MGWLDWLMRDRRKAPPIPTFSDLDFIAIDVETAAAGRHTICQFGAVGFHAGQEVFAYETLIDPQCEFHGFNVSIHGITAAHVRGSPCFKRTHSTIHRLLSSRIVAAHSNFDQGALADACQQHRLPSVDCRWLDTVSVARRAWPDMQNHKLRTLADHFGYQFKHHSAVEDARVAGLVLLRAMEATSNGLEDWFRPARKYGTDRRVARDSSGEGPLAGHCVVMTGDFSAPKPELADLIAQAGGSVSASVSKRTTILVLGVQDPSTFAGKPKSSKHLKAEELIAAGHHIQIFDERELRSRLAPA
jgi:DNA polymerase-3 subunit epsilon